MVSHISNHMQHFLLSIDDRSSKNGCTLPPHSTAVCELPGRLIMLTQLPRKIRLLLEIQ